MTQPPLPSPSRRIIIRMLSQAPVILLQKLYHFVLPPARSIYYSNVVAGHHQKLQTFNWSTQPRGVNSTLPISTKDYLLYAYCIIMSLRYLAAGIAMYHEVDQSYFRYDIVMYAIKQRGKFDKLTFTLCSLLLVYCFAEHYIRNYWTNLPVVAEQDRYIGKSFRTFWQYYPQFRLDLTSRNVFKIWVQLVVRIVRLCWSGDRLKVFSDVASRVEVKNLVALVKFNLIVELINLSLFCVFKLLVVASVFTYLHFTLKTQSYTILQYLFICFDRMGTMALGAQCMNGFAIGSYNVQLFARVYGRQYAAIDTKWRQILRQLQVASSARLARVANMMAVNGVIGQHVRLTKLVAYLNAQVVSREFYIFIVMNLPFNIYLVTRIILGKPPQSMVVMINLIQVFCGTAANLAAIHLNRKLYHNAALYVAIQQNITGTSATLEKFKVLTLYEEVNLERGRTKMMGFTAGPLGLITAHSSFHFIVYYLVYAIFSCTIIQDSYY